MPLPDRCEVLVVGAGAVGGAVARELASRGRDVVVAERFGPGHRRGSSGGPTRIFRFMYPDPFYVGLAMEALGDWERLEEESGTSLLAATGGLYVGERARGCLPALRAQGAPFEQVSSQEALERYGVRIGGDAIVDPNTRVVSAAGALEAQLTLASRAGAEILFETQVLGITHSELQCRVDTTAGSIGAGAVVIAAGAWCGALAEQAGISMDLRVTCEEVAYFRPPVPSLPVVIDWGDPLYYLTPAVFGAPGVKVGRHHLGREVDPEDGPFEPVQSIEDASQWLGALTEERLEVVERECCLYTNAPAEEFQIRVAGPVTAVSACSGHGFKFAPRMGRAVADIVEGRDPGSVSRFLRRSG